MRELHVVGLSSDGKHLVLTATKGSLRGTYLLAVSPRLTKALAGELDGVTTRAAKPEPAPELAAPEPAKPQPESRLTPKVIQARLRAGQAPERVARAAGVPVDRVTRFSGPVLAERALIVSATQEAVLTRARLGSSAAPLGESIAANLAAREVPVPDTWTAFRRPDGAWTVRLDVVVRGRERRAEWTWTPASRTLVAANPYGAELGYADAATVRRFRARPKRRR